MDNSTQHLLAQIHKEYLACLPQRITELHSVGMQLVQNQSISEQEIRTYYKTIHDLAGSSGIHGYQALAKTLRQLDNLVHDYLASQLKSLDNSRLEQLLKQALNESQIVPKTPEMFRSI